MKKLFCFLTTSLLLFSCSNDDQVNSNKLDQKSENSIQRIKTQFNKEYKLIPNHEKFKNVDWNNPKVFIYGDNKKGISLKTYNSKNENEFNLLIGYNKQGEEYYFLSTDKPQELSTKDIVMTYNDKTVVYTQEIYGNESNNKNLNSKKSVRSTDTGLISGNDPGEELPEVYMYIRPGLSGYYNPGRTGNYLDYDSMKELDNWNRGGGGGGGSTAVISPAPEDKIIIDKTFEDNKCVKDIYDKLSKTKLSANYLLPFSNNLKAPNLTWKLGNITQSHAKTERDAHYNYTIILNKNNVGYSLEVASTIIHELIHATLYRWHDSSNTAGYMQTNFPGVWDYYQRYGVDEYQHNLMANTYVQKMVTVLKEFDNSYDDSIYEALAWTGLKNTTDYNKLSSDKKQQLENTLENYYKNEKNKTTCK